MFNVKGSIVALVTPFHEDGSVNFDKLKEILEWHVENGTDGILVLGTTGESSTMTHEEDDAVVECTLQTIKGRIPVIVGSGSNCTETAVDKSKKYAAMGSRCTACDFSLLQQGKCTGDDCPFYCRGGCCGQTDHSL